MKTYDIILASTSPRRAELLKQTPNIRFKVVPSHVDEVYNENLPPKQIVQALAQKKAEYVFESYPQAIVLGADTLVAVDGTILGKPVDYCDSIRMFKLLCGRTHEVYTGICLLNKHKKIVNYEKTLITFNAFDEKIVYNYINTGKSMDKAGGYGIQDIELAPLIANIHGDLTNVIGLPIELTKEILKGEF